MHLKSVAHLLLPLLVIAMGAAAGLMGAAPTVDPSQVTRTRRTHSPSYTVVAPPAPAPPRIPPAPTPSPELATRIKETNAFLFPTNSFLTPDRAPTKARGKALRPDEMLRLAARGNPSAQYTLGLCYLNGAQGVEKNREKAKMMFELAAVQGETNALLQLRVLKPQLPTSGPTNP